MKLSLLAKILLRAGIVLSILVYVVIVDLGINAGRIHRGVIVEGVDVGGLTREQATVRLRRRAREMRRAEIEFGAKGLRVSLLPKELGWWGGVDKTVEDAWMVGRQGAPFGALAERFRAWRGGAQVRWAGRASLKKVTRAIDRVERQVDAQGYELRRYKFRRKINRAILTWPRRLLRLPIR